MMAMMDRDRPEDAEKLAKKKSIFTVRLHFYEYQGGRKQGLWRVFC